MAQKINHKKEQEIGANTIALVDAFSLFFKAFFAIRGLTNKDGLPTNAVYGFIRMLQKLLGDRSPEYIAVALESPTVTFRAELHAEYKANRPEPPGDLVQQIPYLKKVLEAWGLRAIEYNGYEADDVIGTLARRAEADGMDVWILSADKDLFQLVTEKIKFLRFEGESIEVYGPAGVEAKMGVRPDQMVDYLALVGDSSDNIPGVAKVGPKTAVDLLKQLQSLENIYQHLPEVKNDRWRELLRAGEAMARLSQRLAGICETIPLECDWEAMRWHGRMMTPAFAEVCRELGFKSLAAMAEEEIRKEAVVAPAPPVAKTPVAKPAGGTEDMFGAGFSTESTAPEQTVPLPPAATHYSILTSEEELKTFVARARKAPMLAIDTETSDPDAMRCSLVGLSMSIAPGEAVYVPIGHHMMGEERRQLPLETIQRILGPVLADPAVAKSGHNVKYDLKVLRRSNLPVEGITFDSSIAQYLLDAEAQQGLAEISKRILNVEPAPIAELIGKGKDRIGLAEVAIDSVRDYACQDADMALRLSESLGAELKRQGLDGIMREIEAPLISVLADMEMEGVRLDVEYLKGLSQRMKKQLADLRGRIYAIAGREFNISSTRQVADLLFKELGLTPTKSGKAGYSTDLSVLESLADKHPLPNLLLQYRGFEKLLSTYVEPLPAMVNPRTGRLHCSFSQTIAATGRLSCSDPNLQNIPVRSEDGKAIRQAFLPNRDDEVLLAVDYSQIELRVLAHLSQDEELKSAFLRDEDIHLATASRIFRVDPSQVTSLMRSQAKVVNFGVLYGMTAMRLSNEFKISRQAAQKFIEDYFAAYPKVREWTKRVIEEGRREGGVRTLSGRLRLVPELQAPAAMTRKAAERIAVNTPVQGTAADMIKLAMVRISDRLKKGSLRGRMILQIHDELIFTTPRSEAAELEHLVRHEMVTALPLDVPVKVNACVGENWAEV